MARKLVETNIMAVDYIIKQKLNQQNSSKH